MKVTVWFAAHFEVRSSQMLSAWILQCVFTGMDFEGALNGLLLNRSKF